jgi:hypothetical protein
MFPNEVRCEIHYYNVHKNLASSFESLLVSRMIQPAKYVETKYILPQKLGTAGFSVGIFASKETTVANSAEKIECLRATLRHYSQESDDIKVVLVTEEEKIKHYLIEQLNIQQSVLFLDHKAVDINSEAESLERVQKVMAEWWLVSCRLYCIMNYAYLR